MGRRPGPVPAAPDVRTAPAAPDEVAADTGTARDAGYRIGDRITVALASGTRTFRLTGLFKVGDSAFGDSSR